MDLADPWMRNDSWLGGHSQQEVVLVAQGYRLDSIWYIGFIFSFLVSGAIDQMGLGNYSYVYHVCRMPLRPYHILKRARHRNNEEGQQAAS